MRMAWPTKSHKGSSAESSSLRLCRFRTEWERDSAFPENCGISHNHFSAVMQQVICGRWRTRRGKIWFLMRVSIEGLLALQRAGRCSPDSRTYFHGERGTNERHVPGTKASGMPGATRRAAYLPDRRRPGDRPEPDLSASATWAREYNALLTAAEFGKRAATSRSSTTTFDLALTLL